MKKLFGVLVITGFISAAVYAEGPAGQRPKPGVSGRLQQMKSTLNLSADQTTAVEAALDEEMTSRRAVMEEMRTKQMAVQKKFEDKMAGILKPDQLEKFKSMRGGMQGHMRDRMEKKTGITPPGPKK